MVRQGQNTSIPLHATLMSIASNNLQRPSGLPNDQTGRRTNWKKSESVHVYGGMDIGGRWAKVWSDNVKEWTSVEGGRRWSDNVKEWTYLSMPKPLINSLQPGCNDSHVSTDDLTSPGTELQSMWKKKNQVKGNFQSYEDEYDCTIPYDIHSVYFIAVWNWH